VGKVAEMEKERRESEDDASDSEDVAWKFHFLLRIRSVDEATDDADAILVVIVWWRNYWV